MEKIIKPIEQQIVDYLFDNGIKNSWLADKLGVTSTHLHFVLKGKKNTKRELTADNLAIINTVLKTNF
jgi:DNA-binding Xre family transcriptional regulator